MSFKVVDRDKDMCNVLTFASDEAKNIFFIFFSKTLANVNTMYIPLWAWKEKERSGLHGYKSARRTTQRSF